MTVREALLQTAQVLGAYYNDTALAEAHARQLAMAALALSYTQVQLQSQRLVNAQEWAWLERALERMTKHHEPLAYVIGTAPFLHHELLIRAPILIPRPETEAWVADLIQRLQEYPPQRILDLCTGSGCIALALAAAFPKASVVAIDLSEQAVALAQENRDRLGLLRVDIRQGDLYEAVRPGETFDVIVANPPYIPEQAWQRLYPSVKEWEDRSALVADNDGTALIEKIIVQAPQFLSPRSRGTVVVEIDIHQAAQVCQLYQNAGFAQWEVLRDAQNFERVVCGQLRV